MKAAYIFILQFTFLGCSSVKIYNQTDMFIDIEANRKDTWIGCTDTNSKSQNSLMTFYVLAHDLTHEFMFRSVKRCLKLENEYRAMANNVSTVRIVGIHPLGDNDNLINEWAPQKFKDAKIKKTWTFIRFNTAKGCESYFKGDCKPERYWGGTSPPKKPSVVPSP